jgi:hypothetical protein
MRITAGLRGGRKIWELDNDALRLTVMAGGGHIAALRLRRGPAVNPFWVPVWQTMDPWRYRRNDAKRYGVKLLAAICGHNLCLSAFGSPSPEEERAGLGNHGEAPVVRWRQRRKSVGAGRLSFTYGCRLPIAQMDFERTIGLRAGSTRIHVREQVRNLARRDVPFTMCEHVTFGPPFLERGVTLFDLPAGRSHTFPAVFGAVQRLKPDSEFRWPQGPGPKGTVDMRTLAARQKNSDFSAQLIDPRREQAWFSAVNPRQGLLIAYLWRRADFPWVGNWEENGARRAAPWAGTSLTRGMEFGNAPFPLGLRKAVEQGRLFGAPTYAWLPARSTVAMEFDILAQPVAPNCRGVKNIRLTGNRVEIEWV